MHEEWVDQITDDFPQVMNVVNGSRASYGNDMGAFLCFMAVRLLEMHRILRADGSDLPPKNWSSYNVSNGP